MARRILITTLTLMVSASAASAKALPSIDALTDTEATPGGMPQVLTRMAGARVARTDSRLGVPTLVWGTRSSGDERFLSALRRMSPEQAARTHLGRLAPLYRLAPGVAATVPASVRAPGSGRGPILVIFWQEVEGAVVFRDTLKVLMNEQHELIAISGRLTPHATPGMRGDKLRFSLDVRQAIARAYADLNGKPLDPTHLEAVGSMQAGYTSFTLSSAARSRYSARMVMPARTRKVLFPFPDRLEPAWYVELNTGSEGSTSSDYYAYVIAATDGRLLFRNNLTVADAFSYRVWAETVPPYRPDDGPQGLLGAPHPTGIPDGYQAPFTEPSLITLQNSPFSQNDPWLPPAATETVGNNVDAYVDISGADGLDGADFRASITAPNTFDRVYNVSLEPGASTSQRMAAVTQLFYVNNFLHDWYYDSGFDEEAGNAQMDNYGRGGVGGDRIRAEAQDFSGLDRSDMATPADGAPPRMQLYLATPHPEISFTVLAPPSIAGEYPTGTARFGPQVFNTQGELVAVVDAGGSSPADGCEVPFANGGQVAGRIALIDRGNCPFTDKVRNAQNAGAIGVVIANHVPGGPPELGGTDATLDVPALSLSRDDGDRIKASLSQGPVTARLFHEAAVFRDGALDNGLVAHEWGHYISNRLVANANGLSNSQGRSLGEGWADFHALLLMVREQDGQLPGNSSFQGAYGIGGYVSSGGGNDGYYFGARRYPYSTELSRNPLTFRHIQNGVELPPGVPVNPSPLLVGVPNAEAHNSGEVWATMLWECYAALLRDRARLTFGEAQQRMKQYLVLAYQLTPPSPTFLEARDALLAAANASDVNDFRLFFAAFARRGAGLRAVAPPRGSVDHSGVVEGFATGKDLEVTGVELVESAPACDSDGVVDRGETGLVRVTVMNTGTETLTATTAHVTTTDVGVTVDNGGLITFPPIAPFAEVTAAVPLSLNGPAGLRVLTFNVTYRDAGQAIPGDRTVQLRTRANADILLAASTVEGAEAPPLPWIMGRNPALGDPSPWTRYEAVIDQHHFLGGNAPVQADLYLTSPPLQVASTGNFSFTFRHRFAFESSGGLFFDGGVIELSTNGGNTWVDIGAFASPGYNATIPTDYGNPLGGRGAYGGVSAGHPSWIPVTVSLGTAYAGQTVQVRFRIGSDFDTGSVGWEVDDISFSGITNTPFNALIPEANPCGNSAPVADAGVDQTVNERTAVTLDGRGSTDPDVGTELVYAWMQTAGPQVVLSRANTVQPTFTAPEVTTDTVLTFQLTVSDGELSSTDTVNITVRNVNRAPVADAGADQRVDERSVVTLNGQGSSDPDVGTELVHAWMQTAGPQVVLSGANTVQPTFTALEVTTDTVLTFQLTVSDGELSSTDTVNITVRNVNRAPVADAGADQRVDERSVVTLNGQGSSDPDVGTELVHAWMQTAGPQVVLSGANTVQPTFTAPEVTTDTVLTFQLTVSDGELSSTDTVNIMVSHVNRAPVAEAGGEQAVDEGTVVALDGQGSSDPDMGTTLVYTWTQVAGPAATLTGADTAQPTFTAPEVTADTVLTFQLTVSDGELSGTDTVKITVRNVNRAPVAHAGEDQRVEEGSEVTLDGSGTDPDGDALTYAWTQEDGPTATLSSAAADRPTFTAPDVSTDTVLMFALRVTDAQGLRGDDAVAITVAAKPSSGPDGGDGEPGNGEGGGCGCSSGNAAGGPVMMLLSLGVALLSRRRSGARSAPPTPGC